MAVGQQQSEWFFPCSAHYCQSPVLAWDVSQHTDTSESGRERGREGGDRQTDRQTDRQRTPRLECIENTTATLYY